MKKASSSISKFSFARLLLKWNREQNTRQMPWKGEKDPYRIWLSEIILQQTRVEQGLDYYKRFIRVFPDVRKLARAPENKVFKLWEGLGYYTRCRNLIASAKYISTELKGRFPDKYEAILVLKGVGPYTAAAIASFAFNLPHAVLDGNVFRVLARIFGIDTAIDSTEGKKKFTALAEELLDKNQPGLYNQTIMDFGATVCKPAAPLCTACGFKKKCVAFQADRVNELPEKEKKINIKKRWFYYLRLDFKNSVVIRQRTAKDIWQGLYEFPLIETGKETAVKNILQHAEEKKWLKKGQYEIVSVSSLYKQQLSHQLIAGQFIRICLKTKSTLPNEFVCVEQNKLGRYAFPQFVNQYLKKG
ncbi:MAG: A/G-specific adenine glycosylase [Bacteroidota bacterium]